MGSRIVVFGATGYTGGLIAERLTAAGERPVLAGGSEGSLLARGGGVGGVGWVGGRSEESLSALAERLGGLEWLRADAMRQNTVFDLVDAGNVLISTVGPFAKW